MNKYREHSKAEAHYRAAHNRRGWVSACGKKCRYKTHDRACEVAARCLRDRGVVLHSYRCKHCNGWHLTKRGLTS